MKTQRFAIRLARPVASLFLLILFVLVHTAAFPQGRGIKWSKTGSSYYKIEKSEIVEYTLPANEPKVIVSKKQLTPEGAENPLKISWFSLSEDGKRILIFTNTKRVWRLNTKGDYWVLDLAAGTLKQLGKTLPASSLMFAKISPDSRLAAYVSGNNIYTEDLATSEVTRLTPDGSTTMINGTFDWVYEEEFELVRAFQWSPDGQKLAFLRFDERAVPEFTMELYKGEDYPELVTFKYPKVGEKNATVTAHIYDLATAKTLPVQTANPAEPEEFYLPRLAWTPGGQLCITRMNRHQNNLRLLLADPATGACNTLLDESGKYYLDLQEPVFLSDGSGFLWQSEKSGFNHLYRYDMQGRQQTALTRGDWDVTGFYGLDEKNGQVFYQAAAKNAMQRELYSVKLNGKNRSKISDREGFHSAQFSSTFDYFIHTYSTANTPPQYAVCNRSGKVVRQLEQNAGTRAEQAECGALPVEFFKVPIKNGSAPSGATWSGELNGWMIKPTAPQFAGQKLPVLMFVYGGPGSQQVTDSWKGANYWWFQMLAQKGYVVACVDNRGTGARGEEFKKMTYMDLGKYETEDQIASAKYLGALPFVDPERIGIFGWSYGGYMSSLCLFKGGEVFKSAIAVAPVTNWKWYDSIYTERYMRTEQENPKGYADNSPVNFADQLKGNYLLVHGMADDNVHFQNAAEMTNQLIAADKQFDTMFYPNRNHGIGGGNAKIHLYTLMTRFLDEKLKGTGDSKVVRP